MSSHARVKKRGAYEMTKYIFVTGGVVSSLERDHGRIVRPPSEK